MLRIINKYNCFKKTSPTPSDEIMKERIKILPFNKKNLNK